MLRHFFLITFRNFKRHKSSFFINIIGLSTGLACTLIIFLWVQDELRFDKFHEKDAQLFQVLERWKYADGVEVEEGTAGLLAKSLAEEMPEIEYAVTVIPSADSENLLLSTEDKNIRGRGHYVSEDFFNVFSFELLSGNKDQVLADKHNIVISEELALKLFGTTENVIDKTIKLQHMSDYSITGIFKNVPANSSLKFDFVLSFEQYKEENPWIMDWGNSHPKTYLVLAQNTNIPKFNGKIEHHMSSKGEGRHRTLFVIPFSEHYFYGKYENGEQAGGRIIYVKLFSAIAVFILLIACINFMNLSTAKATRRVKEVGIKKTIGASHSSLIAQYLGEALLLSSLSVLLAVGLVQFFLPQFNTIPTKQLSLSFDPKIVLALVGISLLTGLVAGSYPALYLSSFNPIAVLKGQTFKQSHNAVGGELWVRKGLVVFQFTLSITLIIAVLVVYKQLNYVQTKNLGYNKDNIIYFEKEGNLIQKSKAFLDEMRKIPGILHATSSSHILVGHRTSTEGLEWEGMSPEAVIMEFEVVRMDYGMIEMFGIQMEAGRWFSEEYGAEDKKIILNKAAINAMGLSNPVGKRIKFWGEDKQIIGVTENFHFQSLHERVKPLVFIVNTNPHYIMTKLKTGKEQETITALQKLYAEFNPGFPFDFRFLDEDFQAQYVAEQRVSILSRYFAGFAILISCMGLYGLVAFAAEQRRKEIGIRKLLGASVKSIVKLLSIDFIILVSISFVIGSALGWLVMNQWLHDFSYRINISWWLFIVAGVTVLLITFCTISFQSIKAATANPVKNLRSE